MRGDAQPLRVMFAAERVFFDAEVVIAARGGRPGASRRGRACGRGFVRLDFDRADARAGFALDQHAIAALKRESAGKIIVEMARLSEG